MSKITIIIGCIILFTNSIIAKDLLKSKNQQASYVLGVEMGEQFFLSKDDIDIDSMMLGLKDAFANKGLKLNEDEMRDALMHYQDTAREREQIMLKELDKKNKKDGADYLAQNSKKDGVITLKSGLQYKVLKNGSGKIHPKRNDTVVTHYKGTLLDGTVFDSSYKRRKPISFPVNGVIKGWTEALQMMSIGDKWELTIPSHLAYGELGAPPKIEPGSTLIFEVELLEIK